MSEQRPLELLHELVRIRFGRPDDPDQEEQFAEGSTYAFLCMPCGKAATIYRKRDLATGYRLNRSMR